jgi:hypothetical protein
VNAFDCYLRLHAVDFDRLHSGVCEEGGGARIVGKLLLLLLLQLLPGRVVEFDPLALNDEAVHLDS